MATTILKCPVCDRALTIGNASATCDRGHAFDLARSGYLNLLLPNQRHSPEPGDSPAMLNSRRTILQAGFYEALASGTHTAVAQVLAERGAGHIADLGCGEGFFLDSVARRMATGAGGHHYYGVDISRTGIKMATVYGSGVRWVVASLHDSPFLPQSLDVVLSTFAPIAVEDVRRILRPDGALISVTPGPDHLDALRAIIYPTVVPHAPTPSAMVDATGFDVASTSRIRSQMALNSREQIMHLLAMTPYYWNISRETKARVETCARLELTVDAYVNVFRPR